jgi:hypothetical protein
MRVIHGVVSLPSQTISLSQNIQAFPSDAKVARFDQPSISAFPRLIKSSSTRASLHDLVHVSPCIFDAILATELRAELPTFVVFAAKKYLRGPD